jgi:hypothetical protein
MHIFEAINTKENRMSEEMWGFNHPEDLKELLKTA